TTSTRRPASGIWAKSASRRRVPAPVPAVNTSKPHGSQAELRGGQGFLLTLDHIERRGGIHDERQHVAHEVKARLAALGLDVFERLQFVFIRLEFILRHVT